MQELMRSGGLEFLYSEDSITKTIDYESLTKFIKEEVLKCKLECEEQKEVVFKLCDKLEVLREEEKEKEEEYNIRQKQVTTYLECKKSFFGRIRYYFKGKNKRKSKKEEIIVSNRIRREERNNEGQIYDDKEYYTIEDLIDVAKVLERTQSQIRNTKLDIKALEGSIERLTKRIENAKKYIDEIEEHKKSIFEFWRFVDQDSVLRIK